MKAALVLCCLALFVALYAAEYVCNNDGNNKPDCTNSTNLGVKIRNFWDPTRYWSCNATTNQADSIICEIKNPNGTVTPQGFNVLVRDCVPWKQWKWSPNCPSDY